MPPWPEPLDRSHVPHHARGRLCAVGRWYVSYPVAGLGSQDPVAFNRNFGGLIWLNEREFEATGTSITSITRLLGFQHRFWPSKLDTNFISVYHHSSTLSQAGGHFVVRTILEILNLKSAQSSNRATCTAPLCTEFGQKTFLGLFDSQLWLAPISRNFGRAF